MFCAKCGHNIVEKANFCPECGFRLDGSITCEQVSSAPRVVYTQSSAEELSVGNSVSEDTSYFKDFVEENSNH